MVITKEVIEAEYKAVLAACCDIVPSDRWVTKPNTLGTTTRKACYGEATVDGDVLISNAFIGTTAIGKLRNTLRHEFTHLTVGLHRNHDKVFKRVLHWFGGTMNVAEEDREQIIDNTAFKWTVIAVLTNGERIEVGGIHRKTKKYSEYKRAPGRSMSMDGKPVEHFEFIHNY